MKYKVGDKVVLRDDLEVYKPYKGAVYTEVINNIADEPLRINWFNKKNKTYYVTGGNVISSDMIDHKKTATLNRENYAKNMEEQINDPAYQELLKELSEPVVDTVNHPPHYTQGDIETIDIIKMLTQGYTGYEGNLVGNVIKYLARANFKGNKAEDIQKSQFYLNKLVEEIEK